MPTGMYHWLAEVCRSLRENTDVRLTQVAEAAGKDQSGIYRFESSLSFPRDIENVVRAYADTCGISEPQVIWADALHHWVRNSGQGDPDVRDKALGYEEDPRHLIRDNAEIHEVLDEAARERAAVLDRLAGIESGLATLLDRTSLLEDLVSHNGNGNGRF